MKPWLSNIMWFYQITLHYDKSWFQLRFEKATTYYTLCLEKDLLNDWTIVISSGRRLAKSGQKRLIAFTSYSNAYEQLCNYIHNHVQQRYKLTSFATNNLLLLSLINFLDHYTYTSENQAAIKIGKHSSKLKSSISKPRKKRSLTEDCFHQLSLF
ncbi:hypothetical protein ACNVED_09370 [Legionella sp. D16C41]|uniref:hypothetical protein n=1 Tax=Legionella sp. D16C41 TaxID=3402688 RepID=UPI003AF9FB4A